MTAIDLPYFDLLLEGRAQGAASARLFEHFVHWGYWDDPGSATLDWGEFAAAMDRLDAEVVAAAGIEDGQAVLDAGCGFGGTLASLSAKRPSLKLTGLNIDPRQLKVARVQTPGATFVEGDACAMPFPDGAFDRVLAVECIFHFPSRLRFLKEAARVLKPGGRASLSDFVPVGDVRARGLASGWLERQIGKGYGSPGDGWTDGPYAEMAAAAGLRVTLDRDITANTLPTYPLLLRLLRDEKDIPSAERMIWPTHLLRWLSVLRLVRYRIVAFEKPE